MIREGYCDIMTLFGWPVGWAVILALPILLPLVWWDEHVTQPRYQRKMAALAAAAEGGDVEQAPGEAPQSGGDSRNAQKDKS